MPLTNFCLMFNVKSLNNIELSTFNDYIKNLNKKLKR
jgi:hypothetical protein